MTDVRGVSIASEQKHTAHSEAWAAAAVFSDVGPGSVERALFLGVNVCVKFPEAFVAAYESVMAGMAIAEASTIHVSWPKAIWESYSAARSVFSALIEKMTPLEYVTAVVLSQHQQGVDETKLSQEVDHFLASPKTRAFGWYLGMTEKLVETASNDRYSGWLVPTLEDLESKGFLTRVGNSLRFKQKHVEWTIAI